MIGLRKPWLAETAVTSWLLHFLWVCWSLICCFDIVSLSHPIGLGCTFHHFPTFLLMALLAVVFPMTVAFLVSELLPLASPVTLIYGMKGGTQ